MNENDEVMVTIPVRLLRDLVGAIHDCADPDGDIYDEAAEYEAAEYLNYPPKSEENIEPVDSGKERQPSGENNTKRGVICSDSICDYCSKVEKCNSFEAAGDCFKGRKLTPVHNPLSKTSLMGEYYMETLKRYEPMWLPYDKGSVKMDEDCEGGWLKVSDVEEALRSASDNKQSVQSLCRTCINDKCNFDDRMPFKVVISDCDAYAE